MHFVVVVVVVVDDDSYEISVVYLCMYVFMHLALVFRRAEGTRYGGEEGRLYSFLQYAKKLDRDGELPQVQKDFFEEIPGFFWTKPQSGRR
jgi:hypothetical protein